MVFCYYFGKGSAQWGNRRSIFIIFKDVYLMYLLICYENWVMLLFWWGNLRNLFTVRKIRASGRTFFPRNMVLERTIKSHFFDRIDFYHACLFSIVYQQPISFIICWRTLLPCFWENWCIMGVTELLFCYLWNLIFFDLSLRIELLKRFGRCWRLKTYSLPYPNNISKLSGAMEVLDTNYNPSFLTTNSSGTFL